MGGGAGLGQHLYFAFASNILETCTKNISGLELFVIIIAVKLLKSKLSNKKFIVNCDNEAAVDGINFGRINDDFLLKGELTNFLKFCYFFKTSILNAFL